jgi:hypothetical protein
VELPFGIVSFQVMFLVSVQVVGRLVSLEMPLLVGPRQLGQFSALAKMGVLSKMTAASVLM